MLLAAIAGIAAFALNLALLRAPADEVLVGFAARDLDTGTVLDADGDLRFEPVRAVDELLGSFVTTPGQADGAVAVRPLSAGRPVLLSDLASAGPEVRAMSVPVDRAHAVGGAIVRGDRIDLVSVVDGDARVLLADADVLAVPEARSSLAAGGGFHVVLAVADADVLAVAEAMQSGTLEVVRIQGPAPTGAGGGD
jgi:Flp pilus assembly protein CpaB